MNPRFFSLWAINDNLRLDRLTAQLLAFKEQGLDGVVFHPRSYPNDPEYLSEAYLRTLSALITEARKLGLDFWLYDENGWPSGTVGGALLRKFPRDRQRYLNLVETPPERPLLEFKHTGKTWYIEMVEGSGVDYLSRAFTAHFIEMTYERYRVGLSAEAFAHVSAIFCDEPEFGLGHAYDALSPQGSLPWTDDLPRLYEERTGMQLLEALPALFMATPNCAEIRVQFRELLTDVFCSNFLKPINDWCLSHGKLFTAHIKGEEHPLFQVPMVGSCQQVYRHLGLPGIDALERYPSNNFFPRQVATVAQQFGNADCMVECFGGAGWGATPEDLERYLLWLGENGLTHFVLHISQYRLHSEAIRDWPASQPFHLNWADCYGEVLARVRSKLAGMDPRANTLYVAPYRRIMAEYEPWELMQTNVHNASAFPDSLAAGINRRFMERYESQVKAGLRPHVCDERSFEDYAEGEDGGVRVGNCLYRYVIVDEEAELSIKAKELLETLPRPAPAKGQTERKNSPSFKHSQALTWTLATLPVNTLFIETQLSPPQTHTGLFSCDCSFSVADLLRLRFADTVEACWLNGIKLDCHAINQGCEAEFSGNLLKDRNQLEFCTEGPVWRPFVWLQGCFNVKSATPFSNGPNGTRKTKGPFSVSAPEAPTGEWVSQGYPFLDHAVVARTRVEFPEAVSEIQFGNSQCDALALRVDNGDLRWIWGPMWTLSREKPFTAGVHELEITLIPSTYNRFGPHRYLGGDAHVISPAQFSGTKNFADPVEFGTTCTHGKFWNFKPVQLPDQLFS
jgi:hypothetical protein